MESTMKSFKTTFVLAIFAIFSFAACDGLFEVSNPSFITDDEIDEGLADAVGNTPEALFGEGLVRAILMSDLIGDGLMFVGSVTEYQRLDQGYHDIRAGGRTFTVDETYNALGQAQWMGDDSVERLQDLSENPAQDLRIARSHIFGGLSTVVLADNYEQVTFDGGPAVSDMEAYDVAAGHFNDALQIAQNAGDTELTAVSYAALARVWHAKYAESGNETFLATAADYATDALQADENVTLEVRFSISGTQNNIPNFANRGQIDVGPSYDYIRRESPYTNEPDPRVPVGEFGGVLATGDSLYFQEKFPDRSDNIPVIRFQEMNLINAEHQLVSGSVADAVEYMNINRRVAGLGDYETTDGDEALEWLIYERATEFWLEGRRFQDMRRFDLFPTARWAGGAIEEGTDRKIPIPITEQNTNPNL